MTDSGSLGWLAKGRWIAVLFAAMLALLKGGAAYGQIPLGTPDLYPVVPNAYFMQMADVDADGHADVVTGSAIGANGISILWGNGDGTFAQGANPASTPTVVTEYGVYGIKVADLNGDQLPDIVVGHSGAYYGSSADYAVVLLNQGNRQFQRKPYNLVTQGFAYGRRATPGVIEVADTNGDGRMDIVTNYYNGYGGSHFNGAVVAYVQDANGDFGVAQSGTERIGVESYAGANVHFLAMGDFNGDTHADAAVSHNFVGGTGTSILLGNGDGSFTRIGGYGGYSEGAGLAVADFNHDGKHDILQILGEGYGLIYLGNGDGTFTSSGSYFVGGYPVNPWVADMDGDGNLDFLTPSDGFFSIAFGDGQGGVSSVQNVAASGRIIGIAAGDFDEDGENDVAAVNNASVFVYRNTTVPTDTQPPQTTAHAIRTASGFDISLQATDDLSGVAATYYRVDGEMQQQTYSGPFSLSAAAHTIEYWSVDGAGNVEPACTLQVKVTATVTVRLTDSAGNPLAGGMARYYAGSWRDIGTTAADGTIRVELDPGTYTFSVEYAGGRVQKSQSIAADGTVAFQTLRTTVHLTNSAGNPLAGGFARYYGGSWRDIGTTGADGSVALELLPGTYTFSVEYGGGRTQKSQNIATDPNVRFQTVRSTVTLRDSAGNPLSGGVARYYAGAWRDLGVTGADGTVGIDLPPGTYTFSIEYGGGRVQKSQNVATDPNVLFQTVRAVVRLRDSAGNPLAGGVARYYAGSWRDMGTTGADGTVGVELPSATYTFSVEYAGGRVQKSQNVASGEAQFQTGRVRSVSGTCIQYYGGTWRPFVNDMELLPLAIVFRFSDGTPNTTTTVVAGAVTDIH